MAAKGPPGKSDPAQQQRSGGGAIGSQLEVATAVEIATVKAFVVVAVEELGVVAAMAVVAAMDAVAAMGVAAAAAMGVALAAAIVLTLQPQSRSPLTFPPRYAASLSGSKAAPYRSSRPTIPTRPCAWKTRPRRRRTAHSGPSFRRPTTRCATYSSTLRSALSCGTLNRCFCGPTSPTTLFRSVRITAAAVVLMTIGKTDQREAS